MGSIYTSRRQSQQREKLGRYTGIFFAIFLKAQRILAATDLSHNEKKLDFIWLTSQIQDQNYASEKYYKHQLSRNQM